MTNTSTNSQQRVLTGSDGSFSVSGLAPGSYRVDVETAGFKRTSQQNIELATGSPAAINIVLEPGNINETVEIKASSPMVQTDNAEVAAGLVTRTVRELPVIDRNHQELVGLMSGITPPMVTRPDYVDPARNREWSTNGQSPLGNYHMVDGVTNQEPFRGQAVRVQPDESIQQLRMTTANWSAEKGYTNGTFLHTMTRPGTNDWHGSLFEFHSDNNLRTRDFYNVAGNPDPKYVYNQFGGTAGGHIIRDRLFFFGSYEGTYQRGARTELGTLPTADMRAGVFSGLPAGTAIYNPLTGTASGSLRQAFFNNTIPRGLINPFSAAIAANLPEPNLPGFVNNYVANVPFKNDGDKADGRIDMRVTDRTSAFLRYGYTNYRVLDGSLSGNVVGSPVDTNLIAQNAVLSLNHNFGPNLTAEGRFGYNRYNERLRSAADLSPLGSALGLSGTSFMPSIQIGGMNLGAPANVPQNGVDNTFNWNTGWTLHTSMHHVKWGVDVLRNRSDGFWNPMFGPMGGAIFGPGTTMRNGNPAFSPAGSFVNSWASFLLGAPGVTGNSFLLDTPTYRQSQYAAWVGDTINIMRRLTVDLGLRYEIYSPIEPRRAGGAQFFDPANNTLSFAGTNGLGMHVGHYDLDNFAPRVGLALRVTDKTAVRAGYAMSYFQNPFMFSGFMPATVGSFNGVAGGFSTVPGRFAPTMNAVAPPATIENGITAGNMPMNVVPIHRDTPYVQTFNFEIQQELPHSMMFEVGYLGTLGRHLPYMNELNAAMPGAGIAGLPFGAFGRTASTRLWDNALTNNYNSLQVNLTKRFARSLSFQAAYTYSKAMDYGSGMQALLNPFDRRANYGPADWDRTHNLVISHLWQIPFGAGTHHNAGIIGQILGGWQLSGIFRWATGTPFNVYADPLLCACPGSGALLANVNGPVDFSRNTGLGQTYFNTAAFSAPASGQFGNLGRNSLRGPGFKNYDMSLFKSFGIENYKLEVRGEAYNVTNTPRFGNPITNLNAGGFGQVASTMNGAFGRQINLALRLLF